MGLETEFVLLGRGVIRALYDNGGLELIGKMLGAGAGVKEAGNTDSEPVVEDDVEQEWREVDRLALNTGSKGRLSFIECNDALADIELSSALAFLDSVPYFCNNSWILV